VLSRRIAESGRYPAIDIEASVSRAMHEISSPEQLSLARQLRVAVSTYEHHRDLIAIGAYQRGSDPRVDSALALWPRIQKFLQQDMQERVDLATSLAALQATLAEDPTPTNDMNELAVSA
jgi:flagellum-specific ATP synthase